MPARRAYLHEQQTAWVVLPEDAKVFAEFYPSADGVWSADAQARWRALLAAK